ncbi:hypothetical protein C6N75_24945, partial [Streptomyces solincola]
MQRAHRTQPAGTTEETAETALDHPEPVLIRDPAGRLRGAGFVADHHGTVLTSHQAVDGLTQVTVDTADGATRPVRGVHGDLGESVDG